MGTYTEEDPKKKSQPQLVKLSNAFKLAEQWVNDMSKSSATEKSTSVELEGRPLRLGIGATVPTESKFTRSNNAIERKLLGQLHADKRKKAVKPEDGNRNGKVDDDSEEDESESKTRAFAKKRPPSLISHQNSKKRRR